MDDMISYDAILFPADGRPPHVVSLPVSPVTQMDHHTNQIVMSAMPHPEVHMDGVADESGQRVWRIQVYLRSALSLSASQLVP